MSLGYSYTHFSSENNFQNSTILPFARYYFSQKKLAPYVEVAYGGGWTRSKNTFNGESTISKNSSEVYRIGVGVNYFIAKNVAIESNLSYDHVNIKDSDYEVGSFNLNVGLQFFLR